MKKTLTKNLKLMLAGSVLTLTLASPLNVLADSKENKQIPLREVAEAIGATVKWNAAEQQATVTRGAVEFTVTIGEATAVLNGDMVIDLESAAQLVDKKTVIPLDSLKQAFMLNVDWDADSGLSIDSSDTATLGTYFVHLLLTGQYDNARSMMNEHLQGLLPSELMPVLFNINASPYGTLDNLTDIRQEKNQVHHNAVLQYITSLGLPLELQVRFDPEGKVDDFYIGFANTGAYQKPSYDDPSLYTEEEVVVGEGKTALPGTLTLPKGEGTFPAVVLVHGSGPNDRNESNGSYQMFRDLAVGLSGKGIAVLRFEKQTREHALKGGMNPTFTVKEESVDDTLQAVKLLLADERIDAQRVFVIGHSQGGMLVPKIIEHDNNDTIAGAVILAGPAKPLEDVLFDQNKDSLQRLIDSGQPDAVIEQGKQQVAALEQQISLLKDEKYSTSNIPQEFALGNAYWWYDFRNYYGGEIAKKQTSPLLILQGDNDFQVTGDHLDLWKQALSARDNVEYKLYPKLNHYFVQADQPSTGAEYNLPGNVSEEVIQNISEWILKQK